MQAQKRTSGPSAEDFREKSSKARRLIKRLERLLLYKLFRPLWIAMICMVPGSV